MTAIGILGLDTSHGEAFADILQAMEGGANGPGPTIEAVWDGGAIRTDEYVESFCTNYGATRVEAPVEMVDLVDAALVLAVDWERHVPLAEPFLAAGIAVLIDKPIAGSNASLERLRELAGETPVFGGSAVPFHPEFTDLRKPATTRTVHLAGYHDYFYYRVHVVDAARRLVGADWTAVEPIADTEASMVGVSFSDGTWGTLRFDGSTDQAVFAALDVGDRTRTVSVDASEDALRAMYRPYLEAFLEGVHGAGDADTDTLLDAGRLLLAVEATLSHGRRVVPGEAVLEEITVPSTSFLADYEPYY